MPLPRPTLVRFALATIATALALAALAPATERQYLSGRDTKDAVSWEFSVTAGRRAGEWSTIPVPSQWEQHGFGTYNYGQEPVAKSAEHGLYRLRFAVPETWKGRRIRLVFEGAMTDATVKVNGTLAGPTHVGAFYRFHYDVTSLVKLGAAAENLLEVDVAKVSSNSHTEAGERQADYWVFGGIFRPVWLEAAPKQAIEHTAIDARADGAFSADVTFASVRDATQLDAQLLAADGSLVGDAFSARIPAGGVGRIRISTAVASPRLWTAETPHLYSLRLTLRKGDEALHTTTTRFGFRTFEVRAGLGLFLNGQRILLKGVNRHSFRPETARALSRDDCYADARLIKAMNMNSVRMSHYPPDEAFLEACDELGLYVLNELSGWHHAHDTDVGRRLVRAMIERDVNHPSILFWDNGNEGGWNRELDGEFALHDPQKRHVLHPWELHDNMDTKHYPTYDDLAKRLTGPHLLMPTEFVHALYDGGAGAGLDDYWKAISQSPFGAGGFIWVLADEGIVRTDQGGRIDVFGTYAPDGLVGPRHEKEGSYHTVRDLWSPVQIVTPKLDEKFDGTLTVTNHYDFTSLTGCRFAWQLVRHHEPTDKATAPTVLAEGTAPAPAIAPHATGRLELPIPGNWREADALQLTAFGPDQQELWTWTWPTRTLAQRLIASAQPDSTKTIPKIETAADEIRLIAGNTTARFDAKTGVLRSLRRGDKTATLTNGPRLAFARPESAGPVEWFTFASEDAATQTRRLAAPQLASTIQLELDYTKSVSWAGLKLEISPDGQSWRTIYDGTRRGGDGRSFNFPPQLVAAVRLSNIRRSDGQPIAVKSLRLGYATARFLGETTPHAKLVTGEENVGFSDEPSVWLETRDSAGLKTLRWTLFADGSLKLDYSYALTGDFIYHGVTFDLPEDKLTSVRWLGEGPYRVWQNRLHGTWLGVHEIARNDIQAGESFTYPEFQGYFAGLRWARFATSAGPLTVTSIADPGAPPPYLRIGTPRINHQNTTVDFPAGDISFLHAIPAMGSKFVTPEKTGPASQPAKAKGTYHGSLVFTFAEATPTTK